MDDIADIYFKMGRSADAREHYKQYLALFPSSPGADEGRQFARVNRHHVGIMRALAVTTCCSRPTGESKVKH